MSQDVIVLPVDGLGRVASPAALEAALVRTTGVRSVSMNVSAGRVRIVFEAPPVGLRDLVAIVCAAGCGLHVSQTMLRARGTGYPWCNAKMVEILRRIPGVVEAAWDRSTEFVVVSYLPSLVRSRALVEAILSAGYRLADDPMTVPEISAIHMGGRDAALPVLTRA